MNGSDFSSASFNNFSKQGRVAPTVQKNIKTGFTDQQVQPNNRFQYPNRNQNARDFSTTKKYIFDFDDPDAVEKMLQDCKIEGTSQLLEKPYYRLTEIPDPAEVRPQSVLKKSLAHVLAKYARGDCDVHFMVDQFRSIRLDMKIQQIHNEFTVQVYEQNCLFCLKHGIIDQFNQCLIQLYILYKDGIPGNRQEFLMYQLLYMVLNNDKTGLDKRLKEMTTADFDSEHTMTVLELRHDLTQGNFIRVFRMMTEHPLEGVRSLVRSFENKLRVWALLLICKTFKPSVTLKYIMEKMSFESLKTCEEFLTTLGCDLDKEKGQLKLKESKQAVGDSKLLEGGFD